MKHRLMKYRLVAGENFAEAEREMNELADQGYRLHSWKVLDLGTRYRIVAVMALQ